MQRRRDWSPHCSCSFPGAPLLSFCVINRSIYCASQSASPGLWTQQQVWQRGFCLRRRVLGWISIAMCHPLNGARAKTCKDFHAKWAIFHSFSAIGSLARRHISWILPERYLGNVMVGSAASLRSASMWCKVVDLAGRHCRAVSWLRWSSYCSQISSLRDLKFLPVCGIDVEP